MSGAFPKSARLRRRSEFQRVSQSGLRQIGKRLIVEFRYVASSEATPVPPRLGITVSRHHGKSHERNRFKRIVREGFRRCQGTLRAGLEINIKPRAYAKTATSQDIQHELVELLSDG